MPNSSPWEFLSVMSDQRFNADLVVTASAYAIHPAGADVPPPIPAESADTEKE